jgi:hypothetical protein
MVAVGGDAVCPGEFLQTYRTTVFGRTMKLLGGQVENPMVHRLLILVLIIVFIIVFIIVIVIVVLVLVVIIIVVLIIIIIFIILII